MMNPIKAEYGPIAFIDIAGFGNTVKDHSIEDIISKYASIITSTSFTQDILEENFDLMVFSDTLTIRLTNHTDEGFHKFVKALHLVMHGYFYTPTLREVIQFPLRGSITIGEYCWINGSISTQIQGRKQINADKINFILGKAILEAHEFEKKQNWFCVSMSNSTFRELSEKYPIAISTLTRDRYLVPYNIPVKGNSPTYGWVVNPTERSVFKHSFEQFLLNCNDIFYSDSHDSSVKLKYYNTLKFYKFLHTNNLLTPLLPDHLNTPPIINEKLYSELIDYFEKTTTPSIP